MDNHVHRSMAENSLEVRIEVHNVSNHDRISQRTVKTVLHERI